MCVWFNEVGYNTTFNVVCIALYGWLVMVRQTDRSFAGAHGDEQALLCIGVIRSTPWMPFCVITPQDNVFGAADGSLTI